MRPSGPALAAAAILTIEGIALGAVCAIELVALGAGQASSTIGGLALIVLTLIAAVALVAFAYGVLKRLSWARSGGILLQVLALALALASLTVQPVQWAFTLGLGVLGAAGLAALIATVRKDGAADPRLQGRQRPSAED